MGIDLLILAAEAEERTGLDLVLPPVAELVGGLLAFLVVAVILMKFAFPAIRRTIEAREQEIRSQLEGAESAKAEAEKLLRDYRAQLADAKGEANRIIEEARAQAEQVRKDLVAKAEKEADAIVARAQEQIAAERARTVQQLQRQIADMSIELASKVVGRSLDGQTQRELVDAYIREVAAMNGGSSN